MSIMDIARTYVGTPHINGGDVKGAGLDCCTLVTNLYADLGYEKIPIKFGYSGDWYCQKHCTELLLPYLEKYCDKTQELRPGDLVSYRWGRSSYAHLAVYLGDNLVIHCDADDGTNITEISNPKFYDYRGQSRATGYWRLKDEFIPKK